ncbi:hypothetical protein [Nonomuraea sp. NPDC049158]|uniref:hypothetical protein n=1 Tax=Nonomuraea sp. NPDC049158 TaxID=3155649 RepID=UPI0033CB460D
MPADDPPEDISYGEKLRRKNLQVRTGGWSWRTRDQVLADSSTSRTVRDQAGNDVTERTDEHGGYHRDVTINLRS